VADNRPLSQHNNAELSCNGYRPSQQHERVPTISLIVDDKLLKLVPWSAASPLCYLPWSGYPGISLIKESTARLTGYLGIWVSQTSKTQQPKNNNNSAGLMLNLGILETSRWNVCSVDSLMKERHDSWMWW